jgi:hypothetical protein
MKKWLLVFALILPLLLLAQGDVPTFIFTGANVAKAGGLTVVQHKGGTGSSGSVSVSFTTTPTVGTKIVVLLGTYGVDPATVTDNQGNTYAKDVGIPGVGNSGAGIFTATASTSSGTFTVTYSTVNSFPVMAIAEVSGVTSISDTSETTGNSTTPSAGTITVPSGGLLFGVVSSGDSDTTIAPGAWQSTQIFERETVGTFLIFNGGYGNTAGDQNPGWTYGTGQDWSACAIAIQ